jgi:5-formyltetrahydrofolate cyclo-ligase
MTDIKAELRRHSLAARDLVSHEEARAASAQICSMALPLIETIAAKTGLEAPVVSVYWPIRSELNTRPLIEALAKRSISVVLPVMHAIRHPLIFRAFTPGDDLVKGPFGLSEPSPEQPSMEPDIVFSPLAAFDRKGYRLGYGGGIYDATLAQLRARKPIVAIGLAFACQEADAVPTEPHDQQLDYLLTEREVIAI